MKVAQKRLPCHDGFAQHSRRKQESQGWLAWQLPRRTGRLDHPPGQPLHARLAWRLLPLLTRHALRPRAAHRDQLAARGRTRARTSSLLLLPRQPRTQDRHASPSLLLRLAVTVIAPGERLLLALDDTPTKRYGPQVEGAGIHHNPTPGPADQKFLYGHVWVTLAWLVRHPRWGAIGLPLRALLYVRPEGDRAG